MRKDSNIIIRVDSGLKGSVMKIAEKKGYTLSDVVIAFLRDIERKENIPLNLYKFLPRKQSGVGYISIAYIKLCVNEIIFKMEDKDKINKVYLFGSFARGEEKATSDIDLRMETNHPLGLIRIGALRQDLITKLGRDVDLIVSKPSELDPEFYSEIKKDEVCIYEG